MQTELLDLDSELWLFQLPHEVSLALHQVYLMLPGGWSLNTCLLFVAGSSSLTDLADVNYC